MSFKLFDQNLQRVARALPKESLPESLHTRILSELPSTPYRFQRRQFLTRLAVAGFATATVAAGMVIAPRYFVSRSYAAEVRQAIANAKTWHFSGWRLVAGKRVAWEVWGRRSPYLYRESIGAETVFDDGTRRVHVIPPDLTSGRTRGTYLVTPSERLKPIEVKDKQSKTEDTSLGFLAGTGSEAKEFGTFRPTPNNSHTLSGEATQDFFNANQVIRERAQMQISATNYLPTHYQVVQEEYTTNSRAGFSLSPGTRPDSRVTIAEITPTYDVPFPQALTIVPLPLPGYVVADAMTGAKSTDAKGDTCIRKGLKLHAYVVGQDDSGNIRLRFSGRLGSQTIRYSDQGLMLEALLTNLDAVDDQGNRYIYINQPLGMPIDGNKPEVWLTPLEPKQPGSPSPTQLDLGIRFRLGRYEKMGNSGRSVDVLGDSFTFLLPLPQTRRPLGYDEAPGKSGVDYVGVRPTLRMETAEKRGQYCMTTESTHGTFLHSADGSSVETEESKRHTRNALTRATYWFQIVDEEAKRTKNSMMHQLAQSNINSIRDRLAPSEQK